MQTALNNDQAVQPWYTHRWPWFLMLGPFLVVLAGTFTGWLAYSRPDALVVGDYYKQGSAINRDLRRDRTAADLQLHLSLRYDPAAGKLSGVLDGSRLAPGGKILIRLVHSTLPEKDILREAQPDSRGNFTVDLAMLEMARWQIVVEDQANNWRLTGIWAWPKQQAIELKADTALTPA